MIKIVHLITDLLTGGAETMLCKLVTNMDRAKFENIVVSMTDTEPLGHLLEAEGIQVYSLDMPKGVPDPRGLFRLATILKKTQPAILQTWLYHSDFVGLIVGKAIGISSIVWNLRCSNMKMGDYSKSTGLVFRLLVRLSNKPEVVIVNSKSGQELHERLGYNCIRWENIPNGFDLDKFHPDIEAKNQIRKELGLIESDILIGLIARYDPMKDHKNFLEAASLLTTIEKNIPLHFIMVGRGVSKDNKELTRRINEIKQKNNFHYLGERNDIPKIMASLDIASLSSAYGEGFPNVVGEAMCCGVPCVVTDVGDSALLVGDTGLVVPPRNPQALADAWKNLLYMSIDKRIKMGLAARKRMGEQFSLSAIVARYESLYEELCYAIQNKV